MTRRVRDRARDRYHSLSISSVWSLSKLREARALVVGAGALGNEVAKNLAMMGVSLIVVIDRDIVETANLTRSVFFRESDHGQPKATILAERLRDLNPDVEILPLNGDMEAQLGLGFLRRMEMVFSCLDSRLARRNLNRMCEKMGCSWVDGAMEDLLGEVAVYTPGDGPCYECGLTRADLEVIAEAKSCRGIALQKLAAGKVPTTPTMGSIVSAIQVQEAVKLLQGDHAGSLVGRRLVINCQTNDYYSALLKRRPNCGGHGRAGGVTEVAEWGAASTSPRDLLSRFEQETGEKGSVDLGREVVTQLTCPECQVVDLLDELKRSVTASEAACPRCGHIRVPDTTHTAQAGDRWLEWPLAKMSVPKLDVLHVMGATASRWYELSGDLSGLPEALNRVDALVN